MPSTPDRFELVSDYSPTGDQPKAIEDLVQAIASGRRFNTLLGATGTGKTFTMANVIAAMSRPALIISHNKTLAAQLYEEMRELFPRNAVSYFVSYYDYYQPEAYIPQRDIYIEKDASRNDDLDRLRLAATSQLLSRRDVIIVASVSCIFGLGSPADYAERVLALATGQTVDRRQLLLGLSDMQYTRSDIDFKRGTFRVRGDVLEVHPAYEQYVIRIELFGDDVERLELVHPTTGEVLAEEQKVFIFPAVHYVMPQDRLQTALASIRAELDEQVMHLRHEGRLLEAQRLLARTRYDLEMMEEVGYCSGIENYARHLEGRAPGSRPSCLLDYFRHAPGGEDDDWLCFIDESHMTIPQVRAMFNGDRQRKEVLVTHGFRLPSALDNRPLTFDEFEQLVPRVVFVSATPARYELERSEGMVTEQIILVTVLTKRLAEDLTNYLHDQGLRVRYLHSEIDTLERVEILRERREGRFAVLVGVNLLRDGLDLPEVSLVCIVDADKAGFLRSETSLIQTMGRAARNVNSQVILFADQVTPQMQAAMDETARRRAVQQAHNQAHGITPETIRKAIRRGIELELKAHHTAREALDHRKAETEYDRDELIVKLEEEMLEAARALEFERAATLRDQIAQLRAMPEYGRSGTVTLSRIDPGREQPGGARSSAGRTGRGSRRR
jgi:excinuclease ABC subunit B